MRPLLAVGLWAATVVAAGAFDPEQEFTKGATIIGLGVNGGVQNNIQNETETSDISFVGLQPRLSHLFFEPFGASWYKTALEPGLEGWFQYYIHPQHAGAGGLKLAARLHAIGLGPLVPYVEGLAGAGGTGLN